MDVKQRIANIIEARKDLSVRGVSLAAGLSDSALHKYLTKPDHSMTIDNLQKVADAMGVSMRVLLFEGDTEILSIWDAVPIGKRDQAKRTLASFAEQGKAG